MNDSEKSAALAAILEKHDDAINENEGGARPFNEPGEVIEALWSVVNGDRARLVKVGWLSD